MYVAFPIIEPSVVVIYNMKVPLFSLVCYEGACRSCAHRPPSGHTKSKKKQLKKGAPPYAHALKIIARYTTLDITCSRRSMRLYTLLLTGLMVVAEQG